MPTNYIPKCLASVTKPRLKPRRQAIREARELAFNEAIAVVRDACRLEKTESLKRSLYAAITRLEILRDNKS